jgi:hypothetical protein
MDFHTRGRRLIEQAIRLRQNMTNRPRNHQEWYMSVNWSVVRKRKVASPYSWTYSAAGRFCWMTVPMIEVRASRMRVLMVSLSEQKKFQKV